jgi:hypothetical protein
MLQIHIAKKHVTSQWSKHIELADHFTWLKIESKEIFLRIDTDRMATDYFTKNISCDTLVE